MTLRPQRPEDYVPNEDEIAWMGLTPTDVLEGATWETFTLRPGTPSPVKSIFWQPGTKLPGGSLKKEFPLQSEVSNSSASTVTFWEALVGPLSQIVEDRNLPVLNLKLKGRSQSG